VLIGLIGVVLARRPLTDEHSLTRRGMERRV
jgi:hypothetical protein